MNRVVVTGLGIISPVGNQVSTFWDNIINGVCGIDFITKFDTTDYKVKIAAEVKDFKPEEYMDRALIKRTDLYTQYAIAAAHQAMQDSGLQGNIQPDRLGVYIGSGIGGLNTLETECEKLIKSGPRRISPFLVPMMISNIAAGTIAIQYNAQGPALPSVTACATSTNTIGEAYRNIKHGYSTAIIAGGSEAGITRLAVAGFTNCMALSTRNDPDSACVPFDKRRDGFVIGEGAAVLILEEYQHAKARNAKIYAEVVGYGNTCDAYHIVAPHPEAIGAANAIQSAINESDVDIESISDKIYINAHGTSTPLNDKTETLAFKKVFGEHAYNLNISSTKSMIGHTLGSAGAIEAIASILALNNQQLPPTIGYQEPDPECDLFYIPNKSISKPIELALSVSLGFGGHNACVAFASPIEK